MLTKILIKDLIDGIISREGTEYTNSPSDRGGPTKFGITLSTLSHWRGRNCQARDVEELSIDEARQIYYDRYIVKPRFDEIQDPRLRSLVVDTGVLHGIRVSAKWLQSAVNMATGAGLVVDGRVGSRTLNALSTAEAKKVFAYMLAKRYSGYADIVQKNRSQLKWLEGWNNRTNMFLVWLAEEWQETGDR